MFMDILVRTERFCYIYIQIGLISVNTDRFTKVFYDVYSGRHLSIRGKPSPIMFMDVVVCTERFAISVYR